MTHSVKIDRELLLAKLQKAIGFISKKNIIPAWENFRLDIASNVMSIAASDGQMDIKLSCAVASKTDFSMCVPAALLLKTVSLWKENEVTMNLKSEKKMEIRSGKSRYGISLDCQPEHFDLMKMDTITSEITMHQASLALAFKSTKGFINEKDPRAGFTSLNINEIGNKIIFTALQNGLMVRCALRPISIHTWTPINIYPETAKKIVGLLGDKGEINVVHSGEKVKFFTDHESPDYFEVTSTVSNTKFPNTEKLFDQLVEDHFTVNTVEMRDAIRRLMLYSETGSKPCVEMSNSLNPKDLHLCSKDTLTNREGEEMMSVTNEGNVVIEKTFNADYLIDILGEIDQPESNVHFKEGARNVYIIPKVNSEEENMFTFLVTPIMVAENIPAK